ncbi:nitroreductase [Methanolinea mesophila]|uniref:Acg family FMN-binding oxidoreductase n=1 Tax=Methanolinea mesophila TaxID=547055 RepID=UPI001AE6463D|nr:nitroreductase family protein [Methanolinea mesophila]MBP1929223.1 nitroreductase [Methanolinea mesophila]
MVSPHLSGHDPPLAQGDVYREGLPYAVHAPSLLNAQPWRVEMVKGQSMRLWIDRERMFPALDPVNRHTLISQATFLENFKIAASYFGYRTSIDYFPLGWGTDATIHEFPIAQVECSPSPDNRNADPLFPFLMTRQTCRTPFDKKPLDNDALVDVAGSFESEFTSFVTLTDPEVCREIGDLVARALPLALGSRERTMEWIKMVRFDEDEARLSGDGIGLSWLGGGESLLSVITGKRLSREKVQADPELFCAYLRERCAEQVRSAAGYGWISTKGKSRVNLIHAGRALERVWLHATSAGIGLQPYHHVLGDYPGTGELHGELKDILGISGSHTVQAFFRLGYAASAKTRTFRRPPESFLMPPP